MLQKIKSYLKFLLNSTNKHSIHSPFIYNLVTKCFNKNTLKQKSTSYLQYKQLLLDTKLSVKVTDFGAGSQIFKNDIRKISKIAKVAGISNRKAKLLIRFVNHFKFKNILEIGTSLGLGTTALQLGNTNATITTLEGCPETAKIAAQQFEQFNFKNINIIVGDFKKTLSEAIKNKQYDLIYFDGNHQKKATLNYFESCLTTITNDSVFIFDDIHWSSEMEEAWNIIKQHPKVTASIDIYYWGIIFFRKEQEKEHFIIRVS